MNSKIKPYDLFLLSCLVVIWGTSFAMSKFALRDLDSNWVATLRLLVAAAFMMALAIWNNQSPFALSKSWPKYLWLGFIGNTAPFLLITWGIHQTTSGIAGLLMGTIPLFVVVLAHFILPNEKLTWQKIAGFTLGFIGIIILIGPENLTHFALSGSELQGQLAIVLGCLCYGLHSSTAQYLGFDRPFQQTAGILLAGAIMALLYVTAVDPYGITQIKTQSAIAVLGLGLIPTALATVIVYHVMERVGPSVVSFTNYLVPIFALLVGYVLFGEALSVNIILALIFVLSGVAVSRLSRG